MTATALLRPGAHGFIAAGNAAENAAGNAAGNSVASVRGLETGPATGPGRGTAAGKGLNRDEAPALAIVVPARDAQALRRTLRGLALETAWEAPCAVLVATGNADAAALAREAGAQLLPLAQQDAAALEPVLRRAAQLLPASTGWVLVVRAGSDLAPDFLEALRGAIADNAGHGGAAAHALQCRLGRRGAGAPPAAAPARLGDNGFALSRAALDGLLSQGPRACEVWRVRGVDGALLLDDGPLGHGPAPWTAQAPLALRALRFLGAAAARAVRRQVWRGRGAGRAD